MKILNEDTLHDAFKDFFNLKESQISPGLSNEVYYCLQEISENANEGFDEILKEFEDRVKKEVALSQKSEVKE